MTASSAHVPQSLAALDSISDAVLIVDDEFRCTYANPAATELLGYARGALVGAQLHELLRCGVDENDVSCAIQVALVAGDDTRGVQGVMRLRGGQWLPVATSAANLIVDGTPSGAVIVVRDASEQVRVQDEVLDLAHRHRQLASAAPDPFFSFDPDGAVTLWNDAAEDLFGHTAAQVVGRDIFEILVPERHRTRARDAARALMEDGSHGAPRTQRVSGLALHRDGHEFLVDVTATSLRVGERASVYVYVRDLKKPRAVESDRQESLLRDPMTGLPNRVVLVDRLEAATRRISRSSRMVAVLFIDVDHFKVINDSLGHDIGDELLVAIAERLLVHARDGDTVARFGGDEFVVVMEEVENAHDVVVLAQRLSRAMGKPILVADREITSSVSIGIAIATDSSATPRSLLSDADAAMYRAKERGRNRFELFDDGMRQRAIDRLELEGELRRAIDETQLRVLYQPIMSVEDQHVVGFEALVRWQHPTRGLLGPAAFIHLAEETGLIGRIGEWVLHEALQQHGEWLSELSRLDSARELTMAVNLSASQVTGDRLPEIVAEALATHEIPAQALCLEITESVLMDDSARAGETLQRLRELGVRIALDDFGTGYSSLLYLREFPVDILKIDRFFVAGLGHSPADRAIAASVVSLAHALNMVAVGEGVELIEQKTALHELGCDFAQGFLWARPLTASAAAARLGILGGHTSDVAVRETTVASVAGVSTSSDAAPLQLVLIDDNVAERRLLALTLDGMPEFEVVGEAHTSEEGVAAVARTQPDVVLLDLSMPGLDGVQTLPLIAKAAPDTRVVIVSGFISEGARKIALAGGAVGCLDKNSGVDRLPIELLTLLRHTGDLFSAVGTGEVRRRRDRPSAGAMSQ